MLWWKRREKDIGKWVRFETHIMQSLLCNKMGCGKDETNFTWSFMKVLYQIPDDLIDHICTTTKL